MSGDFIRCTTCLEKVAKSDLVWHCAPGCRRAQQHREFPSVPVPDPWPCAFVQSWPCPVRKRPLVLTEVSPAHCRRPLLQPAGLPDADTCHVVILAMDNRASTSAGALAAMASSLCASSDCGDPALTPVTPGSWRVWRHASLAPGRMPFPGPAEPAVFGRVPKSRNHYPRRVFLHSWPLEALLAEDGALESHCTDRQPLIKRLLNADQIALAIAAPSALDSSERQKIMDMAVSLGNRLKTPWKATSWSVEAPSPKLSVCLVEAEVLMSHLGSTAARPRDVREDPESIIDTYVLRSARVGELLQPVLDLGRLSNDSQFGLPICALAGLDEDHIVGMLSWRRRTSRGLRT